MRLVQGDVVAQVSKNAETAVRRSAPALTGIALRHELVYEDLCTRIRSGEYALDTQLPGERELAAMYRVSRVTIRQALAKAEQDGIVTKVPGLGNFVSRRRVAQDLTYMQTFRSVISALEMHPSYTVLRTSWIKAQSDVAKRLRLPEGEKILQVDSVGMASGRPMAGYCSMLSPVIARQVQPMLKNDPRSTYELAAAVLGVDQLQVEQTFQAVTVDEATAELLQVSPDSAALRASSVFTLANGEPIEFRTAIYPSGRYSFNVRRIVMMGQTQ